MNKKQVLEIIKVITTYYPSFKMDDPQGMVNAWHLILKDYEFDIVSDNLVNYVKNNRFAPGVADLIKVSTVKDRAIPNAEETKAMLEKWNRTEPASKEVREKSLAEMRKILGIKRG